MLHLYVIGFIFIVVGCSQSTEEQQFIASVNEMFEAEEQYRESQKELQELEGEEQLLLQQTLSLQPVDELEIERNVEQLKQSVKARQVLIKEERQTMERAKKSMKRFQQLQANVKEGRKQLELFNEKIGERYLTHEQLMDAYEVYMKEQQNLYELLAEEQLEWQNLEVQVGMVNDKRAYVVELIEKFNEITAQLSSLQQIVLPNLSD